MCTQRQGCFRNHRVLKAGQLHLFQLVCPLAARWRGLRSHRGGCGILFFLARAHPLCQVDFCPLRPPRRWGRQFPPYAVDESPARHWCGIDSIRLARASDCVCPFSVSLFLSGGRWNWEMIEHRDSALLSLPEDRVPLEVSDCLHFCLCLGPFSCLQRILWIRWHSLPAFFCGTTWLATLRDLLSHTDDEIVTAGLRYGWASCPGSVPDSSCPNSVPLRWRWKRW